MVDVREIRLVDQNRKRLWDFGLFGMMRRDVSYKIGPRLGDRTGSALWLLSGGVERCTGVDLINTSGWEVAQQC